MTGGQLTRKDNWLQSQNISLKKDTSDGVNAIERWEYKNL